jgi:hypothetical protein
MTRDGFIVPPWVRPDQPPPKDVPQPLKTITEPLALKNEAAKRIAATYILTVEATKKENEDDFWTQAERAKKRGWQIHLLTADHNPQWSAPEALADLLNRIATDGARAGSAK